MKKYLVEKGITLHSETLELTDDQSGPRMPFLSLVGDGVYVPTIPVQFKAGEIIGIEPINKSLLMSVSEIIPSDSEEEKKRPGRPPKAK